LTQKALAQSLGMSTAWLSQVKRGDIGRPDFEKLQKLGELLSLNAGELIFGKPDARGGAVADIGARYVKRGLRKKDLDTKTFRDSIVAGVLEELKKALPRLLSLSLNQVAKETNEETARKK